MATHDLAAMSNGNGKRKRIDWTNPEDVRAVVIGSLGFSNKCVQQYCGLSNGQIYYRLKLGGLSKARRDFRDGVSPLAKAIMKREQSFASARVERMLAKPHQTDSKKIAK